MIFLKGFRENWAIQSQHIWNTPACLVGVLDRQVASFHTIEALIIFCFIVSLELMLFLVGDSLMLRRIPQLDLSISLSRNICSFQDVLFPST